MMFGNLIESGSHARDFRRKGSFFLATFVFYSVLVAAAGVASIYAYNTHLEGQQYQVDVMLRFPPSPAKIEPERPTETKPAADRSNPKAATERIEVSVVAPVVRSNKVAHEDTPEVKARMPVMIGHRNLIQVHWHSRHSSTPPPLAFRGATLRPGASGRFEGSAPEIRPTPGVKPTPQKLPKVLTVSRILNGSAISKPAPPYPQIAKTARVSGVVAVQILIDEQGRVVSAQPTSGHPLLRQAATQAAYQARFSPTYLGEQPVKVSGVITYNFVLQ